MKKPIQTALMTALLSSAMLISACNKSDPAEQAAVQQLPPAIVDVQVVTLGTLPIIKTFAGRVVASEVSEVRPQATGIIDEVLFQEGSVVQAGQPLYRLNMDNYASAIHAGRASVANAESAAQNARAAEAQAQANLVARQAALAQAQADVSRLKGLVEVHAVSKQSYDQAVTAVRTAEANVQAAQAAVAQSQASIKSADAAIESAKASLGSSELEASRTVVKAPISGKISISNVTKGALVSANQTTPLATISRTNQVYVDISHSSAELLKLRQDLASGKVGQGSAEVQLVLENGEIYPTIGRITLANSSVDKATGAVTLRAVFDNADDVLIPGMYVNANLIQSVVAQATLLPQSAIMRTPKGETQVYVVNQDKKIEVRNVTTAGTFNGQWVVSSGLQDGDMVVVMGASKVKPDQEVEARILPPAGGQVTAPVDEGQSPQAAPQPTQADAQPSAPQDQAPSPQAPLAPPAQNGVMAPTGNDTPSTPSTPSQEGAKKPEEESSDEAEAMAAADESAQ